MEKRVSGQAGLYCVLQKRKEKYLALLSIEIRTVEVVA